MVVTMDDGERPHGGAEVPANERGSNGKFVVLARGE